MTHTPAQSEALDRLIADVEAGIDLEDLHYTPLAIRISPSIDYFIGAYNGSLDAAKALHDALLPGWIASVGINLDGNDHIALVGPSGIKDPGMKAYSPASPARAWLLAILRAYRTTLQ